MFKTIIQLTLKTTAKGAGYAYGYSSLYAKTWSGIGHHTAEEEIKDYIDNNYKSKKKKGK